MTTVAAPIALHVGTTIPLARSTIMQLVHEVLARARIREALSQPRQPSRPARIVAMLAARNRRQ